NFFSFFTIQTNILAAAMLALAAVVPRRERSRLFDAVRGAIALYISITGVVFALLLSGLQEELDTHIAWVDFTVHKLIPIVFVLDWLVDPSRHRFPLRLGLAWLSYPLVWFAYTLVRGASEDWYPYPFVDVLRHGYGRVLLNVVVLFVCIVGAAVAYVWIGNWRAGQRSAAATTPPEP
ncbi:MAG: Pr6Pr family membrane protein, partial [Gaiellaceae bacterium]